MLKKNATTLSGVYLLEPKCFADTRGFFFESFNEKRLRETLNLPKNILFVQDNHSYSKQHVLRGLHYQTPHPQGKLVRVIGGEVYDVAVDMRPGPTYGKWEGFHLSGTNQQMLWIPPGFAHGFLTLSPEVHFLYKITDYYDPSSEQCIRWDDPTLAITWPITSPPDLSPKDLQGKSFKEAIPCPVESVS